MARTVVEGTGVDIGFDGKLCIHARQCVLGNPAVFVPNAPGQWIHPDADRVERIVAIAESCPSGAITYHRKDGGPDEAPPAVNTLRVRENGPYALHAEATIAGEAALRATLCRCGASSRKPYCDGSHEAAGFSATGEVAARESLTLAVRNGPVAVTPLPDGPLKVEGNLEVVTGTGHTTDRVRRAFLCRCGHSKDKPYCDGSHKEAGFRG